MHLVQSGRFAIRVATPLGDMTTVAIRGPGESFGEMALTVAALEDAETMSVYKVDFEQVRARHPASTES